MDVKALKRAERDFLQRYPGGFQHPEMLAIAKKHPVEKMTAFAHEAFADHRFENPEKVITDMATTVTRSSMVSMFEKPRFRDHVKSLPPDEMEMLSDALYAQLHGDQAAGFDAMVAQLKTAKLAKWTLLTIIPFYFRPQREVFVKPNTTKDIIKYLGLDLHYQPTPSWAFYEAYRAVIDEAKTQVSPDLSHNSAAFTGFLMMTI